MGVNPRVDDGPQDLGCIATSLMGYVFFTECTCYRYSSQNVHVIVTRLLWLARLFRLDVRGCRSSVCLMLVRILGSSHCHALWTMVRWKVDLSLALSTALVWMFPLLCALF